jgi:hypothetical protein
MHGTGCMAEQRRVWAGVTDPNFVRSLRQSLVCQDSLLGMAANNQQTGAPKRAAIADVLVDQVEELHLTVRLDARQLVDVCPNGEEAARARDDYGTNICVPITLLELPNEFAHHLQPGIGAVKVSYGIACLPSSQCW